jgi:hypothetical protein
MREVSDAEMLELMREAFEGVEEGSPIDLSTPAGREEARARLALLDERYEELVDKVAAKLDPDAPTFAEIPGAKQALRSLYAHAREIAPQFEQELRQIAQATGATFVSGGVKGTRRAFEKVVREYGGDAARIKDLVRGRLIVDDVDQLEAVLSELKATGRAVGARNNLEVPNESGFRDIKVYLDIDGHIAEVQVLPSDIAVAKEQLRPLYERARQLPPVNSFGGERFFEYDSIPVSVADGRATAWDPGPRPFPPEAVWDSYPISREEFDRLRSLNASMAREQTIT